MTDEETPDARPVGPDGLPVERREGHQDLGRIAAAIELSASATRDLAEVNSKHQKRRWIIAYMLVGTLLFLVALQGVRQSTAISDRNDQFNAIVRSDICENIIEANYDISLANYFKAVATALETRSGTQTPEFIKASTQLDAASRLREKTSSLCSPENPDVTPLDGDPNK